MPNKYSPKQLAEILNKIIYKARYEIEIANNEGTVDELLNHYEIIYEEDTPPINPRSSKILVLGFVKIKMN